MAKQYEKGAWGDEILLGDPRYNIEANESTPEDPIIIEENVQVRLVTEVAQAGTSVNADRMNNIEDGVDMLDTIVNQDGVRLVQVGGESDPTTLEVAEVQDGQVLTRSGSEIVGADLPGIEKLLDRLVLGPSDSPYDFAKGAYPGMTRIVAELVGGGGGGGGVTSASSQAAVGAPGSSGAWSKIWLDAADLADHETLTIGAGGAGGAAGNNNGQPGGQTSFGSHATAPGGLGGPAQPASATVPRMGPIPPAGGAPGVGDVVGAGQPGQQGLILAVSGVGQVRSGAAGASFYGGGGETTNANNAANAGSPGSAPGAGGSGGATSNTTTNVGGGNGADGQIIVEIYGIE
ncbi:MAG: hypothetical protein KF698_08250 [Anaerolineales bacterium]|nr:hypothetical protein [Anaerolineales bacterium]